MTSRSLTVEEAIAHGRAIGSAATPLQFVEAFSQYARDVIAREPDPHVKIAWCVQGLLEGQREVLDELLKLRGGGTA